MQAPEIIRTITGYPIMISGGAEANELTVLNAFAAQGAMSKQVVSSRNDNFVVQFSMSSSSTDFSGL